MAGRTTPDLTAALGDFIDGTIAKRSQLELRWEGKDVTGQFLTALEGRGYRPLTVAEAPVDPGERAPAFLVRNGIAYFGWIFWEKFTAQRMRKLFGSVVRNHKGDWAIQVGVTMPDRLYMNQALIVPMDIDAPSGI